MVLGLVKEKEKKKKKKDVHAKTMRRQKDAVTQNKHV